MIDLKVLRDTPDVVRASQVARGDDPSLVDAVLDLDARRRAALTDFERLRSEQKTLGKQVAQASGEAKTELLAHAKGVADGVKALQADADAAAAELDAVISRIGNVVLDGVPAGGENDYVVLRHVGTPRDLATELGGAPVRDHLEIGERLGAIDTER
ncbi:MAG: serine--tRNA ligase, partial [Cellulomonadaceae bacterium]|nr:serine--tRNA ligase [Cellulomonadaceae bacterium]